MMNRKNTQTTLDEEIISLIKSGYKTQEIERNLGLKRRDLIKEYYIILANYKELQSSSVYKLIYNEYLENFFFQEFSEETIAIISDTHLASKHENVEYLKQVKDFLKNNDIKYLLHGGDIGDGMVEYAKKYSTYPKQLDHILDVYDLGPVKQYILGGNHDSKYKRKNPSYDILTLLEENNSNIEAVGYYQSYFKLSSNVVSFEHNSRYKKSFNGRNFSILGHAHCLSYKDSTVVLPTLSDSFPNSQNSMQPGFIILENKKYNNKTSLEFTNYKTTDNGIEKGKVKTYRM